MELGPTGPPPAPDLITLSKTDRKASITRAVLVGPVLVSGGHFASNICSGFIADSFLQFPQFLENHRCDRAIFSSLSVLGSILPRSESR